MFVINLKDILRKIIVIIFLILFIKILMNVNINKFNFKELDIFKKKILITNYENEKNSNKISGSKKILSTKQILFFMSKNNKIQKEKIENTIKEENENVEKEEYKVLTQIIDEKNKIDTYTNNYKNVKIKNESDYNIDLEIKNIDFEIEDKDDIIIYHTHTCESYTSSDKYKYNQTENYRTTDLNYTVAKVGDELSQNLENCGFNVIHNRAFHDYPAYTGSYTRGLETISNILEKNKCDLVIDLHRDALGNLSSYAPTIKINDEIVAQVMFVIGTDGGGLEHPNWRNNLKNAIKIQEKAEEMYPGFFKPIIVRNSRYNQHVASGACIIEVGATGNSLEECISSMKYLSKVFEEVYK